MGFQALGNIADTTLRNMKDFIVGAPLQNEVRVSLPVCVPGMCVLTPALAVAKKLDLLPAHESYRCRHVICTATHVTLTVMATNRFISSFTWDARQSVFDSRTGPTRGYGSWLWICR